MKRAVYLFVALIIAFTLFVSSKALGQEKVPVKVKSSEVVTGVVIVHVQKGTGSLELQCNQGVMSCKALASGNYLMRQLPENNGMYDCKNVEMYRGDQEKPEEAQKVGAYCLIE
jgi:hypothetical protein